MNPIARPSGAAALFIIAGAAVIASAQQAEIEAGERGIHRFDRHGNVWHSTPGQATVTFPDGARHVVETEDELRPMCGSAALDPDAFAEIARIHRRLHADRVAAPIALDAPQPRLNGLDVQFDLDGSVPAAAIPAFQQAESYIESFFDDPVVLRISVSFANLGSGVLGANSSTTINSQYNSYRNAVVADADADDTLQTALPAGTLPVRYNASSSAITQEDRIRVRRGLGNAVGIGFDTGVDGSQTYSNQFPWDFDPTNGVPFNRTSLVDVIIHEVGHAMGFTSAIDSGNNQIDAMDTLRFVRSGTFDPATLADFTNTARTVDLNNPNGQHTLDIITAEYRAEDGSPAQASHFREQGSNIGLMDPSFSSGQTFVNRQPFGFYSQADLDVFDFLGWDYALCEAPTIVDQPTNQSACVGDNVVLSVNAPTGVTYQWSRNGSPVTNGFFYSGATTDTLTILNITQATTGTYTVEVTNAEDCSILSTAAVVTAFDNPSITDQPDNLTVDEGQSAVFSAAASGAFGFRWQRDGQPLSDGGNISGATTTTLTISNATPSDAGQYRLRASGIADCFTLSSPATLAVNAGATPCSPADLAEPFGIIDIVDVDAFIVAFIAGQPAADLAPPTGIVDIEDIDAFIALFLAGCP